MRKISRNSAYGTHLMQKRTAAVRKIVVSSHAERREKMIFGGQEDGTRVRNRRKGSTRRLIQRHVNVVKKQEERSKSGDWSELETN